MSIVQYAAILTHHAPGERRAVLLDAEDHPCRLFLERWDGVKSLATLGSLYHARIRSFADEINGAFLELESGEEVFLRLKQRRNLTQGEKIAVKVESEAREGKLARVIECAETSESGDAWTRWYRLAGAPTGLPEKEDHERVTAAFDEALSSSVSIPGGGQLHIDRTRALTAFDIDTSGRLSKGSAAARALSVNKAAATAMARQVSLRGLGGNLVLDCVSPLNKASSEQIKTAADKAFSAYSMPGVKVLRPSPLGLLEASAPWRYAPIEDRLAQNPGETELLDLFRAVQREAAANPTALYELALSKLARAAYLDRRSEADQELTQFFGGRVTISPNAAHESKAQKR